MVNKYYNGTYIGDSAVKFFDELAKLESNQNYKLDKKGKYIGCYQLGTDIIIDMGWAEKGSTWENIIFKGEAVSKWNLKDKESFLNTPEAQDEIMMKSMVIRWKYLKRYENKIGNFIFIPLNSKYKIFRKDVNEEKVHNILNKKKKQGYEVGELRGEKIKLSSSGILAGAHLCGQGSIGNALKTGFTGDFGIPVDGNYVPFYFYHEVLKEYDLSVIIGYKEDNLKNGVVYKSIDEEDRKNISLVTKKSDRKGELGDGVYEFNGQKFQEISETEEYLKEKNELVREPKKVFVKENDEFLKRLLEKFESEKIYNRDYIKYFEAKTGRKVLENNKSEINIILKKYDELTRDENGIGNVIAQRGFDFFRGRDGNKEDIKIQDIICCILNNNIKNMNKLIFLEKVLEDFSAKYVKYPNKKPKELITIDNTYSNVKIENILKELNIRKEKYFEKNNLPEYYDKYLIGYKDVDDIKINVKIKNYNEIENDSCYKLIKQIGSNDIYELIYKKDKNGIFLYPIVKRLFDNIFIEFIKISVGYKKNEKEKYFDDYKYVDGNIIRNYILWYIKENRGINIYNDSDNELYVKLKKLGENLRITTLLKEWVESKSLVKEKNIKKLTSFIEGDYSSYYNNIETEDKNILYELFKNRGELRDYAANINAMNMYSFYKDFYNIEYTINPSQKYYVNDKCILKCTLGGGTSRLIINDNSVVLRGGNQANIEDKNIVPFQGCKFNKFCKPQLLGLWEKETETKIRGNAALLKTSTIKCVFGGIISIDDAGQKEIAVAKDKNFENYETKRDVDCSYKVINNVIYEVNRKFMQTTLKKQCEEFKKYKKEYEKLKKEQIKGQINENDLTKIQASELDLIRGKGSNIGVFRKLQEYNKENEKNERLNKLKILISEEKENDLRKKIFDTLLEALKDVKKYISVENDKKGIIKEHGSVACCHNSRGFYDVRILPIIAYGYLMKSGNLKINEREKLEIEKKVNKKKEKEKQFEIGQIYNYYEIMKKVNEEKNNNLLKISNSDIEKSLQIGEYLYSGLAGIPKMEDILSKIKKDINSVIKCPFSIVEKIVVKKEEKKETKKEEKQVISNCPNCKIDGKAPWLKIAYEQFKKYKGKKENSEELGNQICNEYFPIAKYGKQDATKVAWCAAFISYCVLKSGYKNSSNPSVGGYDWGIAPRKNHKKRGWFEGEKTEPFVGAIGVFKHKGGYSHVAILTGETKEGKYVFLGGNQNNQINITAYSKARVDYFMKPKSYKVKYEEKILPIIDDFQKAGTIS